MLPAGPRSEAAGSFAASSTFLTARSCKDTTTRPKKKGAALGAKLSTCARPPDSLHPPAPAPAPPPPARRSIAKENLEGMLRWDTLLSIQYEDPDDSDENSIFNITLTVESCPAQRCTVARLAKSRALTTLLQAFAGKYPRVSRKAPSSQAVPSLAAPPQSAMRAWHAAAAPAAGSRRSAYCCWAWQQALESLQTQLAEYNIFSPCA